MATLSTHIQLYKAESRSRVQLASLRGTHRDVVESTNKVLQLAKGENETFVATRFIYAFFKNAMDEVSITVGSDTLHLTNVVGVLTLPFACTIVLNAPSNAVNTAKREAEVWFS